MDDTVRPWCYFDARNQNRAQYDMSGYDLVKDPDHTMIDFDEEDEMAFRRPDPRPHVVPTSDSARSSLERSGSRMSFSDIKTIHRRSWGSLVGDKEAGSSVDEPAVRVEVPDEEGTSSVDADASQDVIEVVLLNRRVRPEDANVNVFPEGITSSRSAGSFRARAARVFRSLGKSSGSTASSNGIGIGIGNTKRKDSVGKEEGDDGKENHNAKGKGKGKQKPAPLGTNNLSRAPSRKLSQIFRPSQSQNTTMKENVSAKGDVSPPSTVTTATYSMLRRASADEHSPYRSRYVEHLENSFDPRGNPTDSVVEIGQPTKLRRRSTTVSTDPKVRLVGTRERGASVSSVGSNTSSFKKRFSVLDLFAAATASAALSTATSTSSVNVVSTNVKDPPVSILRKPSALHIRTRAPSPPLPPLPPSPTGSDRTSIPSPVRTSRPTHGRASLSRERYNLNDDDNDEGGVSYYAPELSYYDPDALPTSSRYSLPLRDPLPRTVTITQSVLKKGSTAASTRTFGSGERSVSFSDASIVDGSDVLENLGEESFCELRLDSLQFDSFSFHPEEYEGIAAA